LAAPAVTGDSSGMWIVIVMTALFGLVAINVVGKKRPRGKHEAFC